MMIGVWDIEIHDAAEKYGLPEELIAAVIKVESGGNPWAIRYEPAFKAAYLDSKTWKTFGASYDTEVNARATSWGLMQVMGQKAREFGYTKPFLSELCRPTEGIDMGAKVLRSFHDRYYDRHGWEGVIASYNAGSPRFDASGEFVNAGYVRKVRTIWA